jgi:hypothetical protein
MHVTLLQKAIPRSVFATGEAAEGGNWSGLPDVMNAVPTPFL